MARIQITISAENAQAIAAIKQVADEAAQTANSIRKAGESAGSSFLNTFSKIGMAVTGAVVGFVAFRRVVENTICSLAKYHFNMEQNSIAMETFLASATGAKVFMQDLQKMAADTPFELPQLTEASKRMLAFGFAAKDVVPTLTAVGNAVSGLGGSAEMIDRVTLAIGQMKAKGRLQGEELLQLAEAGIPAYQILQQKLGLTSQQVANIGNESINADKAIKALVEGMNERFPNMMQKQSNAARGMLSTIKDNILAIGASITENLYKRTEKIIGKVRDFTSEMQKLSTKGNLKEVFRKLISEDVFASIEKIKRECDDLSSNLEKLWQAVKPVLENIGKMFLAILPYVISFANKLTELANNIMPVLKGACDLLSQAIQYIAEHARTAVLALSAFAILTKITVWATTLYNTFKKVRKAIVEIALVETFTSMATGLVAAVKGVNSLRSAILLLGTALKTVSRGNIFTVLFALGLAVVGDKIFEMIDKLKGVEGTTDVDADKAQKEAEEAERQAREAAEQAAGRAAIKAHAGALTQDSTDYKSEYELANKVAATQIEELNNQIDEVKAKISDSIDTIKRKATMEGRDLTPDEAQRLTEFQRDLFQAEVERYTKQKAIIENVLNPADTDTQHSEEIKKKALEAQGQAMKAQGEVDKLNTSLFDIAKAAGNLSSIINSTGDATIDWAATVEKSARQWLNRGDGISRYGDNRINPDEVVCSQLIVKSWEGAGVDKIVEQAGKHWFTTDEASWVPDLVQVAKNLGAYHQASSGYVPQPGDAIIVGADEHHAALINRSGGVINASGRERGVYESNAPWYEQYSDVSGFISLNDLTGSKGAIPMSAAEFAKQYAKNANAFTQSSEDWVNAVKNLINKTNEINLALIENQGNITEKGYKDIENRYRPYLEAFKAAGYGFQPMIDKIYKLIDIEKAKVAFSQAQKDLELANGELVETQESLMNDLATGIKTASQVTDEYASQYRAKTDNIVADLRRIIAEAGDNVELSNSAKALLRQIVESVNGFADKVIRRIDAELQNEISMINADRSLTSRQKQDKIDEATRRNAAKKAIEYEKQAYDLREADKHEDKSKYTTQIVDIEKSASIYRELSKLPSLLEKVHQASKQAFEDGLLDFLERGIIECRNLGDAFRNLAISVLQSIQKVYAEAMTKNIMSMLGFGPKTNNISSSSSNSGFHYNSIYGFDYGGNFAEGGSMIDSGEVSGPGTETSDSILAWVGNLRKFIRIANGEFVMRGAAVRKYGTAFLERINNGQVPVGMLQKYAVGGSLSNRSFASADIQGPQELSAALTSNNNTTIPLSIMNVLDPGIMGKFLRTRDGKKALLNYIKDDAGTIRQILNIKG